MATVVVIKIYMEMCKLSKNASDCSLQKKNNAILRKRIKHWSVSGEVYNFWQNSVSWYKNSTNYMSAIYVLTARDDVLTVL